MNVKTQTGIQDVSDMLKGSIFDVFQTMFGLNVEVSTSGTSNWEDSAQIVGSVGFGGDLTGAVYIYFKEATAKRLASRMLDLLESEIEKELVTDVIGELGNMVVGSVKSRLCDEGFSCVLSIPLVLRGENLCAVSIGPSECRLLHVAYEKEDILVEIVMKTITQPIFL